MPVLFESECRLISHRPFQVLIVNDRPLVRQGLRALLEREGEFCVCGEAEDIVSALRVFEFCPPDIVIVGMPPRDGEGSGLELIANIHMRSVETPVLVQTTLDDPAHAERCLVAGAQGFITEDQAMDKVADAVRHLLAGGIYLTPGMTAALLARYRGGNSASEVPGIKTLSNRELEVFELIGRGKTTREIATELQRSVKTVETHRLRIREKLQLLDTAKLACEAARWVMEKERREPLEL